MDRLNGRYRSAESITYMPCGERKLLRFGRALSTSVCMDVTTGEIVTVAADASVWPASSSLQQFVDTAKAVTARFPFYGEDDDDPAVERVAGEVADIIRAVEPGAMQRGRFWSDLVDDIRMGDFATEWVARD